jgi:hypothetical protein
MFVTIFVELRMLTLVLKRHCEYDV